MTRMANQRWRTAPTGHVRRLAIRALCILALAALATLVTAFAAALFVPMQPMHQQPRPPEISLEPPGWSRPLLFSLPDFEPQYFTSYLIYRAEAPGVHAILVSAHQIRGVTSIADTAHPTRDAHADFHILRAASGWPARAFVGELLSWEVPSDTPPESTSRAALRVPSAEPPFDGLAASDRFIPLRPIPLGFLLNTLFYAAIFLALYIAIGATRRHLRTRRGHCPTCNYNLCGLTHCPECGPTSPTT